MQLDKRKTKIALIDKGLTQKNLAELAGISPSSVSALINGRRFSAPTVKKICNVLDISPDQLIKMEE